MAHHIPKKSKYHHESAAKWFTPWASRSLVLHPARTAPYWPRVPQCAHKTLAHRLGSQRPQSQSTWIGRAAKKPQNLSPNHAKRYTMQHVFTMSLGTFVDSTAPNGANSSRKRSAQHDETSTSKQPPTLIGENGQAIYAKLASRQRILQSIISSARPNRWMFCFYRRLPDGRNRPYKCRGTLHMRVHRFCAPPSWF